MWKPFGLMFVAFKGYSHNIEHAFQASIRCSLTAFEVLDSRSCYACLLRAVDVFLRRRLYAQASGLHLYKMYSISPERNHIYLQMSAAPVPFKYGMSHALKQRACDVLSLFA